MSWLKNIRRKALVAALVGSLFLFSGCALLWLGAGGAGGYLIRKGEEEGDAAKKKRSSQASQESTY